MSEPALHHPVPPADEQRIRVLFLSGWGRSGSTLLDRLLGGLTGFVTVGELRDVFLRGPTENRTCGCGSAFLDCPFWTEVGEAAFGGWDAVDAGRLARMRTRIDRPWTIPLLLRPDLDPSFRRRHASYVDALSRVYGAILEVSGASTVIDSSKIASYALLVGAIEGVEIRTLHLVRDPRGVANSWSRTVERGDKGNELMLRYGPVAAAGRYDLYNLMAEGLRARYPYERVRYEDLVADPERMIERIGRFCGMDDAHLAITDRKLDVGVQHTVDGNPMRFRSGSLEIRADSRWREEMPDGARRFVSIATAPLRWRYGYP